MIRSGVRRSVWLIIPVIMITLAWATALPATARPSTTDSGSEPCPGISLQLHLGTTTPVLLVHGFNEGPGVFTSGSPSLESAITKAVGSAVTLVTFDYSNWSRLWVTFDQIGPQLARCITWLAHTSMAQGGPGKVVIVAHSMGGLAVRCAVDPTCATGIQAADKNLIGLVITLGTPNLGSNPQTLGPVGDFVCTLFSQCNDLLILRDSPAALAMVPNSGDLAKLPLLPASIPVDAIAGNITETTSLFGHTYVSGNDGDIVVPVASALADARQGALHAGPGANKTTVNCGSIPVNDTGWYSQSRSLKAPAPPVTCWHLTETTDARWQGDIITAIKAYLATSTCSPTALTKALAVANPQLNSISWKLKSYACASGWAVVQIYAPAVGNGTAFLKQTASGWNSDTLGEVNCADIPGPLGTPLPPQALTVSLLSKAGICAGGNVNPPPSLPDFYYANAVLPEKLYISPTYPKELAIDNHDGIAIQALDAWGPASMTMTGVLTYDECQPDCAAGPTVTFPVQVIATAPRTCTLQVDQQGSTLPEKAYVYNEITVKALSGNPPTQLVGNSVFKVCKAAPTQQSPTQQGPAPFAVTSSSPTSGPASGGTLIVIHGSGFSSVTKVVMNSIEPPLPEGNPNYFLQNLHPRFAFISDSEIDVTTTAGAAGFTYEIDFITPTHEYFRNTFPGIPLFTYK
jgi:pimeloyl-ACP methyl ester carboxylesterase